MKLTDKDIGKTFNDDHNEDVRIVGIDGHKFVAVSPRNMAGAVPGGYVWYDERGYLEGNSSNTYLVEEVKPEPEVYKWRCVHSQRGLSLVRTSDLLYKDKESALNHDGWSAAMDITTGEVFYE